MTKRFFKLVEVPEVEVKGHPHVISVQTDSTAHAVAVVNNGRPDWVLNVVGGSVGVFNMKKLVE